MCDDFSKVFDSIVSNIVDAKHERISAISAKKPVGLIWFRQG